ncbi:UDP-glucuronic acid dehydrogenase [Marinomonas agarivorans]|nr:UDP-glucuronic acid dehydrogenase [Marinomonas agarivorans]
MKITLLCSNKQHPVYPYLAQWKANNEHHYDIDLISHTSEIKSYNTKAQSDILFLISCTELITENIRALFRHTLVLHASDLPEGRGWSPHIWDILNGKNELTLALLNAEDKVDTGDIWQKQKITLDGTELFDEINTLLFKAELELISWACNNIDTVKPVKQPEHAEMDSGVSYHQRRTPEDSELTISETIENQFNLLRVCDPDRFPAFFYYKGQKYNIRIEKEGGEQE